MLDSLDMVKTTAARVDRATHVPLELLVEKPPFPKSVKIELTGRCNYKCAYCATKKSLRPVGDIDKRFLYRTLNELKELGVEEVGLFLLGESFLVKELSKYIKYAKREVGIPYVFITTNGSLCDDRVMKRCIDAGLDSIKFSINAGNREKYVEMHGVDMFDTVVKNIKWLNMYLSINRITSLWVCASAIYEESRKQELEDLRGMIENYVDEFYYLPLYNQAGHIDGNNKLAGNPGRLDNLVPPVPCWALFNAAKITWDGFMTMCCFDHDEKFKVANLKETSLMEAWHSPKFIELRKKHLTNDLAISSCSKCLGRKSED